MKSLFVIGWAQDKREGRGKEKGRTIEEVRDPGNRV